MSIFKIVLIFLFIFLYRSTGSNAVEQFEIPMAELVAPLEGKPKYPFTKEESINSGKWESGSQDYPYFGAPRGNNTRNHAGVDLYPQGGAGSPVKALADGLIIKISPFYKRANGEVTYGVLVDHDDFVVNYAELEKPGLDVSAVIRQGEIIGRISGTQQLHFELYAKGTTDWAPWRGKKPSNLIDPTEILLKLFKQNPEQSPP